MEYAKELNALIDANKNKIIKLEIRDGFDTNFGQYSQLVFNVDGIEHPYIIPTRMLLSVMQLFIKLTSHRSVV